MKVTILRENEIRECVGMSKEAVDAVTPHFTHLPLSLFQTSNLTAFGITLL